MEIILDLFRAMNLELIDHGGGSPSEVPATIELAFSHRPLFNFFLVALVKLESSFAVLPMAMLYPLSPESHVVEWCVEALPSTGLGLSGRWRARPIHTVGTDTHTAHHSLVIEW